MAGPLLEVRNLRIEFPTRRGTLVAVDDVSFEIAPGEVLGVVGESGAGKSLTGAAIIGLLEPPGRIAAGEIRLDGLRIDKLPYDDMRKIRGREIGAIFQDPLTSLNPLYTVGQQIVETITTHLNVSSGKARERAVDLLTATGIPAAGTPHRSLSASVLGRHAAAGRHRARAGGAAEAPDSRRADHGTRRVDPGADHHAAEAPVQRPRHRGDADHARHGGDRRDRRPRGGHVCRPHRRGRAGGRRDPPAAAPVHGRADGFDSIDGGGRRATDPDRRLDAEAHRDPDGLCVPSALRSRIRTLLATSGPDLLPGRRRRSQRAGCTTRHRCAAQPD